MAFSFFNGATSKIDTHNVDVVQVGSVREMFPVHSKIQLNHYFTGSSYNGPVATLGFTGRGRYRYPHGVEYEGEFKNGEFHGQGVLTYPKGARVEGTWIKGKLVKTKSLRQRTGIEPPFEYLEPPFRSYETEIKSGLNPPKKEILSPQKFCIPEGCYEVGNNCYYHDQEKLIFNEYHNIDSIVRSEEEGFIRQKYRQEEDNNVGFVPDYYEHWCSGRKVEEQQIVHKFLKEKMATKTMLLPTESEDTANRESSNIYFIKLGPI